MKAKQKPQALESHTDDAAEAIEKPSSQQSWRRNMFVKKPKTGVRRIPQDATDSAYAAMALSPNPTPQPWMSDPSALPKAPPKR